MNGKLQQPYIKFSHLPKEEYECTEVLQFEEYAYIHFVLDKPHATIDVIPKEKELILKFFKTKLRMCKLQYIVAFVQIVMIVIQE